MPRDRRLVASNRVQERPCSCRTWGLLTSVSRDLVLFDFMEWAWQLHQVRLKLLAHGDHVAICELHSTQSGRGRARRVMTELCAWADCARVTLEVSPSEQWGSRVDLLRQFYQSIGFQANQEERTPFLVQEELIRYPVAGRQHVRL